ncbi:MAG: hypothetical protein KJ906_02545 [Nanoarchaeota archaeon]|nr:hypothetical protein [Nanoarchaeota archaeon]
MFEANLYADASNGGNEAGLGVVIDIITNMKKNKPIIEHYGIWGKYNGRCKRSDQAEANSVLYAMELAEMEGLTRGKITIYNDLMPPCLKKNDHFWHLIQKFDKEPTLFQCDEKSYYKNKEHIRSRFEIADMVSRDCHDEKRDYQKRANPSYVA